MIQQPTLEWIEKHYPGIFEEVHFGNHFALEGLSRPKSEICKSVPQPAGMLLWKADRVSERRLMFCTFEFAGPWARKSSSTTTRAMQWSVRSAG